MSINQPLITAMNCSQNLNQPEIIRVNMLGNLSVENPTVEQLNAAITHGETSRRLADAVEPAFGEHVREAVDTVRRIFR
jgi:hypothetical protein